MIGQYFEYNGNLYTIDKYDNHSESIKVKLIKRNNEGPLCSYNEAHSEWIDRGQMWPELFFKHAKVVLQGNLLYENS